MSHQQRRRQSAIVVGQRKRAVAQGGKAPDLERQLVPQSGDALGGESAFGLALQPLSEGPQRRVPIDGRRRRIRADSAVPSQELAEPA